jgi:CHAT domain-containing protein
VLNVEHECDLLEEVLGRRQDIRVEICRDTTVSALRQAVRRFSPHVLHFIGHGTYPGASGKGAVLLLGPGEGSDRLAGAELSTLLLGSGDLRLVVLNACDTAALPRRQGVDPYSAVATALLRGRAPAVVAMQFPITDESAISFSGALYDALVDGDPIDLAVVEGRRAIFYRDRDVDTSEWATPTLYLQLQSGDLFGLAGREVGP